VEVKRSRPRDGRSRGFRPIVQSEMVTLSCAGGGREVDVAIDSAVARVARVTEFVGEEGRRMAESFSSQGLKT
jgi:hypothetical protein